jgi:uncharacterized repeat protein (TIGR03803 family)
MSEERDRPPPKYKVLHTFTGSDGAGPYGGVTLDQKGNLYGTTAGGGACGTVFRLKSQTNGRWKETVLYQFGSSHDPCDPWSSVIVDEQQNIYATTVGGGAYYYGTVFELTRGSHGWTDSVLYSFGTQSGDGGEPKGGLVRDMSGNLYGTAPNGGSTAFQLTPDSDGWSETVLHRFGVKKGDGAAPYAGLILDSAGNLYGTTSGGGIGCGSEGCGTVYEIEHTGSGWKEHVLHAFDNNGKDGYTPGGGALVMDGSGNLYGTTETGGCCGGTVFKLTPDSPGRWKETILYNFKPGANGWFPGAGVVMDKAGNLYGTTDDGGTSCSCGVVYKLAPGNNGKWAYTVLHRFRGFDGAIPTGNLILDDKGNLYGGTVLGGPLNDGVVFELTP